MKVSSSPFKLLNNREKNIGLVTCLGMKLRLRTATIHVHVILQILTLIEVRASELLIHIVNLIRLLGTGDPHLVHEDPFLLLHAADPLHVHLHRVEVHGALAATTIFFSLHFSFYICLSTLDI